MLTDCHAHLDFEKDNKNIEFILEESKKRNVKYIIHAGLNKESNLFGLKLNQKNKMVLPALGLYPEEVVKKTNDEIKEELKFIEENVDKAVAISEVGLDSTYGSLEKQKEVFEQIIKIAIKHNKAMVIHTRKAEKDVVELLDKVIPNENLLYRKIVFHCFTGKKKLVTEALKRGWFFSVPPIVVRNQQFQELVKLVPLNRLLTETDSPFLGPKKEERNYPWNVSYSIKEIAKIKSVTVQEAENNIFMNFTYLFL